MARASFKLITDKDLREDSGRLWNLNDSQADLVSMATHQIKTPLAGIKWTLKMLLSGEVGELTAEQKKWIESSYESNERVLFLINEMLESIRVDDNSFELDKTEENIMAVIKETVKVLEPFIKKKCIKLGISVIPNNQDVIAEVDKYQIKIALQNLIENALRYTREGGHVNIEIVKETGDVKISIKDDGIGIPEAEKKDIFSRFFRATNALRKIEKGSGLGLFISKGIIEKHGGKIWFESKEGQGTTFYFIIPKT